MEGLEMRIYYYSIIRVPLTLLAKGRRWTSSFNKEWNFDDDDDL